MSTRSSDQKRVRKGVQDLKQLFELGNAKTKAAVDRNVKKDRRNSKGRVAQMANIYDRGDTEALKTMRVNTGPLSPQSSTLCEMQADLIDLLAGNAIVINQLNSHLLVCELISKEAHIEAQNTALSPYKRAKKIFSSVKATIEDYPSRFHSLLISLQKVGLTVIVTKLIKKLRSKGVCIVVPSQLEEPHPMHQQQKAESHALVESQHSPLQLNSKEEVACNAKDLHSKFKGLFKKIENQFQSLVANGELDVVDIAERAATYLRIPVAKSSISLVLATIQLHCDFFNFYIITDLVHHLLPQEDELQTELTQYIDDINKFAELSQLKHIPSAIENIATPTTISKSPAISHYKPFIIKLNTRWKEMTIKDFLQVLHIHFPEIAKFFSIVNIKLGSVIAALNIPTQLPQPVPEAFSSNVDLIGGIGVQEVMFSQGKIILRKESDNFDSSLLQSVRGGNNFEVGKLLQLGANPNVKDDKEKSAVEIAKASGHTEVVATLVTGGAELIATSQEDVESKRREEPPVIPLSDEYLKVVEGIYGEVTKLSVNSSGLNHNCSQYGVTLSIPEGAVQLPATVWFGACQYSSKLKFGDYTPVTPIVWVYIDQKLMKPAELHLPHYIDTTDPKCQLSLLRADDSMLHNEDKLSFREDNEHAMEIESQLCKIFCHHFCSSCVAMKSEEYKNALKISMIVMAEKRDQTKQFNEFCIFPYQESCKKVVEEQLRKESFEIKHCSKITTGCDDDISISLIPDDIAGWTSTLYGFHNGNKIAVNDIDMYQALRCDGGNLSQDDVARLHLMEEQSDYPPRLCFMFTYIREECQLRKTEVEAIINGVSPDELRLTLDLICPDIEPDNERLTIQRLPEEPKAQKSPEYITLRENFGVFTDQIKYDNAVILQLANHLFAGGVILEATIINIMSHGIFLPEKAEILTLAVLAKLNGPSPNTAFCSLINALEKIRLTDFATELKDYLRQMIGIYFDERYIQISESNLSEEQCKNMVVNELGKKSDWIIEIVHSSSDKTVEMLVPSLKRVVQLRITSTMLNDVTCISLLSQELQSNRSLIILKINDNSITDAGVFELTRSLIGNKTLKYLHFNDNPNITRADPLVELLTHNQVLILLDLENTGIDSHAQCMHEKSKLTQAPFSNRVIFT